MGRDVTERAERIVPRSRFHWEIEQLCLLAIVQRNDHLTTGKSVSVIRDGQFR